MFSLRLRLEGGQPHEGLVALDLRRRYGLPDGTKWPLAESNCGANDVRVELSEDLARQVFGPEETSRLVFVHPHDTLPGELRLGNYHGSGGQGREVLALVPGACSVERALRWLQLQQQRERKAALDAKDQEIDRLKRQIETLEEQLASCQRHRGEQLKKLEEQFAICRAVVRDMERFVTKLGFQEQLTAFLAENE